MFSCESFLANNLESSHGETSRLGASAPASNKACHDLEDTRPGGGTLHDIMKVIERIHIYNHNELYIVIS